ncbi:sulfotransferase family protein [Sulfitobacter guttiformis]|uniref:Sulfotransferase family protein n=1 Tax=Sulfitobacter guttiformis TaxID=74349 RepID=A0A420DHP7_9RHOB|nr:sulfotransferase family protein [Sulfitobacter guttiformis]KIN72503.1 hypothetical protein Z949_1678 [Sulfitobacter guttiformis KCTC 32187]RKE93748.1 hypothetical protein C8N30_2842 [Sulfitobacter guttiformis]
MRAVIHAGMHKTGTTSIQMTLQSNAPKGVYVPDSGPGGGQNGLMVLLFEGGVPPGLSKFAPGAPEVLQRKAKTEDTLRQNLTDPAYHTTVFSAERLVTSPLPAVQRLRDFYAAYCDEIQVILYVRPPVGFMTSAMQEMIKRNPKKLKFHFPPYRNAIHKLDTVFGRENVLLKKFDIAALKDNDVLTDFFDTAGLDLPKTDYVRANEGLSLEAFCLLYTQRILNNEPVDGSTRMSGRNMAFVNKVAQIGTGKLAFDPSLTDPVIEANRDELKWVENRLGTTLDDAPRKPGLRTVASEDDIFAIAAENVSALEEVLISELRAEGGASKDRLLRNLDLLNRLCG